jgi:hypothetical protein
MASTGARVLLKLLPVVLPVAAAAFWFYELERGGGYFWRNLVPPLIVVLLATQTLVRGGGRWSGNGWRMPLGTLGFAIPALGLSLYLHYAYAVNLNGLFDAGGGQLFRFLPYYTFFAGLIGFAIGWIVGRNV